MTAEELCVSLETAKRLHENGIVVESYFAWVKLEFLGGISDWHIEKTQDVLLHLNDDFYKIECYPALTAEELRKYLKTWVSMNDKRYKLTITFEDNGSIRAYYFCYQVRKNQVLGDEIKEYDTLCEAFADTVMTLKEAGYGLDGNKG